MTNTTLKNKELKKNSYSPNQSNIERAKIDKKKVKKNKSPDVRKKKYSYYDASRRLTLFADTEEKLNRMIANLVSF